MTYTTRRHFMRSTLAAGAVLAAPMVRSFAAGANDEINLGIIGCGWRGGQLAPIFNKLSGVNVTSLYDPHPSRAHGVRNGSAKGAKVQTDLRKLLDDDSIDAVVIAACNHWHALAAIWAMQAGKDVYVEKPLAYNQWEGQQVVAAARKYNRICQVGTQQRSDPMQAEIKAFLHQEKALGAIVSARVNRYGRRASIGKRLTPLTIDQDIDYNLWLGPAEKQPIFREKLHYDWHWDWNTGSGEMGNWGAHVLDDLRNNVFQDQVALPKRIMGGGGRVKWDDAGDTPNVHFVYYDTGSIPVVMGLSNLTEHRNANRPGPGSGYIAYCEGGRLEGQRGSARAFDKDGKQIKSFKGNSGEGLHQQNFIDAIRSRDRSSLNAEVQVGHDSTGWCNLANIAFRAGNTFSRETAKQVEGDGSVFSGLLEEMEEHLVGHGIEIASTQIKLSPTMTIDADKKIFVGEHSDRANHFLQRQYRKGFEVPKIA